MVMVDCELAEIGELGSPKARSSRPSQVGRLVGRVRIAWNVRLSELSVVCRSDQAKNDNAGVKSRCKNQSVNEILCYSGHIWSDIPRIISLNRGLYLILALYNLVNLVKTAHKRSNVTTWSRSSY